jgi:putative DNA primase/helicase
MTDEITTRQQASASFADIARRYINDKVTAIVYHQGRTLTYDGTRYVDETHLPTKFRKFLIDANLPHNNHTVSNVVGAIEAIAFRDPQKYPKLPFYVGPEQYPSSVIAFRNGLLDVDAFLDGRPKLMPHSHRWVSTVCLPYDFDPTATCEAWFAFLNEIFDNDKQRIALLQEWCGYCLLPDTSQHKMLCKVGPPRAGKGTTDRLLDALVGEDNTTAYDLHSLAERFGLRRLVGKHVATIGEVNLQNSREKYRILEKLNSIVGGDPQPIEHKGLNETPTVALPTRFNLSCNELPFFGDPTGALSARMLILPYKRSFAGKEDRELKERLLTEICGVSNWALSGLTRLKVRGRFTECEGMLEKTRQFRRNNSDPFAFLQDCLVVERRIDPGNLEGVRMSDEPQSCTAAALSSAYQLWCSGEGRNVGDVRWLCRGLAAVLPDLENRREGKQRTVTYYGIGIAKE